MASKRREIQWILRAQSGDKEALNELFRLVQLPLYNHIRRVVGDSELAGDILQEVFILIFRKLYWLRRPEAFRSWAYRIASREAFRHLRRKKVELELVSEEMIDSLPRAEESEGVDDELLGRLPELLQSISPGSRAVIGLHFLDGMRLAEIADVLEIPIGTVKSRLAYGLSCLRQKHKPT